MSRTVVLKNAMSLCAMWRALLLMIVLAVALPTLGTAPDVAAQTARPRIEVNPRPLHRRCASWYVVQYRPSGRVLFPEKHCWWERG